MAYDLIVMRTASPIQRLAAFLCVLLVLFLALTPSVASHAVAILVLFLCVLPVAIFVYVAHRNDESHPRQAPAMLAFAPRPPPALSLNIP
jgi:fatty acid desaturase